MGLAGQRPSLYAEVLTSLCWRCPAHRFRMPRILDVPGTETRRKKPWIVEMK